MEQVENNKISAVNQMAADKKAELKESIRPLITKLIKEQIEQKEVLNESAMEAIQQFAQAFSDIAEHGSIPTKVLGQALQALGVVGMSIPAVQAIVKAVKVKSPKIAQASKNAAKELEKTNPQDSGQVNLQGR